MKNITLDFEKENGLVPAVIQNEVDSTILMVGFMNEEAFQKTCQSGYVHFWSRTRQKLWMKGETSGNKLKVKSIVTDCDQDALIVRVNLEGKNVCHTGEYSCFFNKIK